MNSFLYAIFGLFSLLSTSVVVNQPQPGCVMDIPEQTSNYNSIPFCTQNLLPIVVDDCSETFIKTFGNVGIDEKAYAITSDGNGNFYIGGSRADSVLLIKMDAAGNLLWQRSFLFIANGDNTINDLHFDSDNNLIGCGLGDNGANDRSGFVFRYNPDANNMLWVQNHQHATLNVVNFDIQEISAGGNFLITGQSYNNSAPGLGCDGYLFELDRNTGTMTAVNEHYNLGSCETFQTAQFYNGSLYTGGRYNFAGGGSNKMRCAATRFDPAGNELWTRLYLIDLVANARLYSTDLLVENDSIIQIHIGDKDGTSANNPEVFLSKANLDGQLDWAKEYTLVSGANISLSEIKSHPNGYAMLGVNTSDDKLFILNTDKDGNLLWAKNYGGAVDLFASSSGVEMIFVDDHFFITGYSDGFGAGDDDMVLLKVNMDGLVNSTCVYIEDVLVNVTNFLNPYDGLHPLTAYPSPIGGTNPIVIPTNTDISEEVICFAGCVEICDNGVDDDGDGLIDCYDTDCCESDACADFYYSGCPSDCSFVFDDAPIQLEIEWESSGAQDWCSYNTPITGDIDNDGIPEIIGKPCSGASVPASEPYPNLLIVDGASGAIEAVINTPAFYYMADGPAIADVDKNGFAEIFIMASDHADNANYTGGGPIISGNVERRVLCYEYNGTTYVEKWISDQQAGYTDNQQAMSVSVADFNEDGIPELYLGSQIFNSLTGELIVEGGVNQHHGVKPIGDNASLSQALTVAVDVLPDEFCLNCGGLELVAGGMVFSVAINPANPPGSMMNVEVIQPNSLPNPPSNPNNKDGFTSIADIDKDGDLDAVITTTNENFGIIYAWDLQTTALLYSEYMTPSSNEGFISQANIADFDGDGFPEIGVCSKSHYQVLKPMGNPNSGTLSAIWEIDTDDNSGSTGSCVFDFNNDGAAEVVYRGETELQILDGSDGSVLTSLPCASGTRVEYPIVVDVDADGETEILCSCSSTLIAYGSSFIPWLSARSVWNQHNYFNVNINDDLTVPAIQQQQHIIGDSIKFNSFLTMYADQEYVVADAQVTLDTVDCNQDGQLVATFEICNIGDKILPANTPIAIYENDPTISANATLQYIIDLGQSLEIGACIPIEIIITTPNTGPLFLVVNDNGTESPPFDLGTDFPLNLIAECDFTNNIADIIDQIDYIQLDLGPDVQMCDSGTSTLDAGSGFDQYEWNNGSIDQSITVSEAGTYYVTTYLGCFIQTDTINVTIDPDTDLSLGADVMICTGESVTLSVLADTFDEYQWSPSDFLDCDNCPTVEATPEVSIQYILTGTMNNGCFSSDTIEVIVGFEFFSETRELCYGESTTIFGDVVTGSGTYTDTVFNTSGCDTIFTITTIEFAELFVDITSTGTCPEANNGTATATVTGGIEPLHYSWSPEVGNTPTPSELIPGQYSLTVTDANNCSAENTVLIETTPAVTVNYETQETSCYDSEDGVLLIDSSALGLNFSLDDVFYSPILNFDQLGKGEYTLYIQDEFDCIHTQNFFISGPPDVVILLPPDTTLRLGEYLEINSITNITDTVTYEWIPSSFLTCTDCPETTATPLETTTYTLMVTDAMGCTDIDTLIITVRKERNVYIPNAFSPNFDGINDVLYIYSDIGVEEILDFKIFDRWGEPVFGVQNVGTNDPRVGWDGSFNGEVMNPGVFVYFAKIRFLDGEEILYSGDVSIVK